MARGYSISINETHHAGKKDAPSGTALRSSGPCSSQSGAPGGDHLASRRRSHGHAYGHRALGDDLIEIRHEAFSRRSFAEGAIRAAEWSAARQASTSSADLSPVAVDSICYESQRLWHSTGDSLSQRWQPRRGNPQQAGGVADCKRHSVFWSPVERLLKPRP